MLSEGRTLEVLDPKAFTAYMKNVRKRTLAVAREVPKDKEHWRLEANSMSPVGILLHIGSVEAALWGGGIAAGKTQSLQEPSEEQTSLDDAVQFLASIRAESDRFWRGLSDVDLYREITTPTGDTMRLSRWLMLAPEHEIHHRSFIHAYRKIWGLPPHALYGLGRDQLDDLLKR